MAWAFTTSKLLYGDSPPSRKPHFLILPTNCGPSVQIYELVGAFLIQTITLRVVNFGSTPVSHGVSISHLPMDMLVVRAASQHCCETLREAVFKSHIEKDVKLYSLINSDPFQPFSFISPSSFYPSYLSQLTLGCAAEQ